MPHRPPADRNAEEAHEKGQLAEFVLARTDVAVCRTTDGAWIGNGDSSFTVKGGAAVFELISALLAALDGDRPTSAVLEEFGAGVRPVAARLLETLVARSCAVRLDQPLSRYAAEKGAAARWLIPHFAQLTAEPLRAMDTALNARLVLLGRPEWGDDLRRILDAAPLNGMPIEYHPVRGDAVPPLPDGAVAVLDADALPHGDIVRSQDALIERGVPHAVAGWAGGRYWLLWSDEHSTGCWDCLRRYSETWEKPAGETTPAELRAAVLAQSLQVWCAGLSEHSGALSIEPGLLAVTPHPAWRAAGCRCSRALGKAEVQAPREEPLIRKNIGGPLDAEPLHAVNDRIIATLAGWTDKLLGPILDLDGGELAQIPHGQAKAAFLLEQSGRCEIREVRAVTLSTREAFYQAALNALELIADPAGLRTIAAGWSADEAIYRALLSSALRAPLDESALAPISEAELGEGECGRRSHYLASRAGGEAPRWFGARLPSGLFRAVGYGHGGVLAHGLGACYGEAVSMALLGALNQESVLVHLNPHFATWQELWEHVVMPGHVDFLPRAVPFARNKVHLVEVK